MSARTILNPASNQSLVVSAIGAISLNGNDVIIETPGGTLISTSPMNVNGNLLTLGNLSFGTSAGFKIIQGSFPCPALQVNLPVTTGNTVFSNAFVNPPSIFMSFQTDNRDTTPYTGLFTFTAYGVSNSAFQAQLIGNVALSAGVGIINWMAIGN